LPILDRMRKAWNAFRNTDSNEYGNFEYSSSSFGGMSPSRSRLQMYNERSIVSAIYTRIGLDVAGLLIKHVKTDKDGRYLKDIQSALNDCFTLETNLDQSPRAFRQDVAMTLFDKGVAAIVPVDTSRNPETNELFDIYTMRVGEIVTWYPRHVRLSVYNENKGKREEITLEKRYVAIIENPLFAVMNEPNSTLQRLIRKLSLLDSVDEQTSSGRLDVIIQLPYVIKSESRRNQAEARREDIEFQLRGSQYGIAYIDGTEKITQLNRPAENNLLKQVEYLTALLYNQLGLTEEVMNGTANEEAMLNYFNRTVEPIIDAVVESMQRAFLGPQGTQNNERIKYFRDPFKLVPVNNIAEIADKFTRNEILTANEIRGFMGIPPSSEPKADQLVNSNMPQPNELNKQEVELKVPGPNDLEGNSQNGSRLQRLRN
jgi:Phage portal protein